MTAKSKAFDCVAMKDHIQAELAEDRSRFGEAEVARRHREWFETSNDPFAPWWRSLAPTARRRSP